MLRTAWQRFRTILLALAALTLLAILSSQVRGDDSIKGTVSRDFLLQVFFMNHLHLSSFSKIHGDIRKSRCAIGINYTGGKVASGVNCTGGKFAIGINDTGGKFCHQYCWCFLYRWQIMGTISDC
jgi:hypothetical protein